MCVHTNACTMVKKTLNDTDLLMDSSDWSREQNVMRASNKDQLQQMLTIQEIT